MTIEKDLAEILPGITIDSIGNYKRDQFKKIVKEKIVQSALEYLRKIQKTHSKVKDIVYSNSDIQKYLIDKRFTFEEKSLLVKLRGSMCDIKVNFRSMYNDNLVCDNKDNIGECTGGDQTADHAYTSV